MRPRTGEGHLTRVVRKPFLPVYLIVGLVALVTVAAVAVGRSSTDGYLPQVPEGVSSRTVDGVSVFISRNGEDVQAFSPDARHLKGEGLVWCPDEEIFGSPMHGEQFDQAGRLITGPARSGLISFPVGADGERLIIDPARATTVEGRSTQSVDPRSENGDAWNAGPGSFCDGAEPASPVGAQRP